MKEIVDAFQVGKIEAFSSVLILTEVLPKPIEAGDVELAKIFSQFLKFGKNISLIEISETMADRAGRLRGRYSGLRTVDAVQISAAMEVQADAFLTNDARLKKIKEIKVLVLKDHLCG